MFLFNLARKKNLPVLEKFSETDFEKFVKETISEAATGKKPLDLENIDDEIARLKENKKLFDFVNELYRLNEKIKNKSDELNGKLNGLYANYVDVKSIWKGKNFIPDANSTLRLTFGRIKGYSPADAVWYYPVTTLNGVIDKSVLGKDYTLPPRYEELFNSRDYGSFFDADLNSVPVNILYDTDTTGGNSGSPVMNAKGELIGLNFDRAFEATINDFAWDESYSRSIGVDIRYILWILEKYSHAENILAELQVKN